MPEYPVLDHDRRPLGFLETHERPGAHLYVQARCRALPLQVSYRDILEPPAIVDIPTVVLLEWEVMHVVRLDRRMYECWCLKTSAPGEHLDRLPGWTWFAERYGRQLDQPRHRNPE